MSELEKSGDGMEESEELKLARADYDQGKSMLEKGDVVLAAAGFHNALVGFEQCGDENGVANASAQLASVCLAREDYEGAIRNCQRAYAICERNKDLASINFLQKMQVTAQRRLKHFDEAARITLSILDTYGGLNNPEGAVATLEDLADIYVEMGQKGKAADALRTAASIHANFSHARQATLLHERADQLDGGAK